MPKLKCECGEIINLSEIPSKNQYMFISDIEYDSFSGMIDAEDLYLKMKIFVQCPICFRIHMFWNGFNKKPEIFKRE